MNVTVYLGANYGTDPALQTTVAELGQWIGKSGHTLVYGGSASGLMGVLARSVMAAGGPVIGVEPQFFIDEGYELDGLTQLIVTQDMTERKAKMIELGDAFTRSQAAPARWRRSLRSCRKCPSSTWMLPASSTTSTTITTA